MTDNNTVTGSPLVKRGLADMLKGGVIMDVVTPNRLRSLKMLALLPSWLRARSRGYSCAGRRGSYV